jgi:hypothetical protein
MLKPCASNVSKASRQNCQRENIEPDLQRARAQNTRALILRHIARRNARAVSWLRLLFQHLHAVLTLCVRLAAFRLLALTKRLRPAPGNQSVHILSEAPHSKHCIVCVKMQLTSALAAAVLAMISAPGAPHT